MPHDKPNAEALAGRLPPWMSEATDLAAHTLTAADVQAWLFPLFIDSERWANVRRLLRLSDPAPWWRGPAPTPLLLYGLPRSLVVPARLSVDETLCCGYWRLPGTPASSASSELRALLSSAPDPPILACFGSLMAMGSVTAKELESLLHVLKAAARRCARALLLVLHPACLPMLTKVSATFALQNVSAGMRDDSLAGQLLVDAPRRQSLPPDWLAVYCGQDVRLDHLLPLCSVAIHHGGSGTTASCWLAGAPQVVLPMFFDQPSWARAVVATGTGVSPCSFCEVIGAENDGTRRASLEGGGVLIDETVLSSGVVEARSSAVAERCAQLRAMLVAEPDGVDAAVSAVQTFVDAWRASRSRHSTAAARLADREASGGPFASIHLEVFETFMTSVPDESDGNGSAFEAHLTVELPYVGVDPAVPVCVIVDCGGPEEVGQITDEIFKQDVYFSASPARDHVHSGPLLQWPRYALQTRRACRQALRFRVVDVGANIGLFGLRCWMDTLAYCTGSRDLDEMTQGVALDILAVEPVQRTVDMLASNLSRAGCAVRKWKCGASLQSASSSQSEMEWGKPLHRGLSWSCVVARCALSDPDTVTAARTAPGSSGTVAMRVWPRILGNATMQPLEKMRERSTMHSPELAERLFKDGYTETVPVATLSEVLGSVCFGDAHQDDLDIDLLKVDVEGSELRVLRGLDAAYWRRIRAVSIEVHDVGTRVRDLLELLTAPLPSAEPLIGDPFACAARGPRPCATSSGVASPGVLQAPSPGAGFSPACVVLNRPDGVPSEANNYHVYAWRA